MIRPRRPSTVVKIVPLLACLCLVLLVQAAPSPAAEGTTTTVVHYTKESRSEFEHQLSAGEIQSATFNKKVRSIHVTLKDGRQMLYRYGAHEQPKYAAELRAKGVPVSILTPAQAAKEPKKPVKHKLRYIAGGILVVVVIVVGSVLFIDRRRKRLAEA
jgi:ATP-dependent Zn protease